ncbi:MAG: OmpA family protein [Acidobacteria bacterium]|jgi:outer membrane protein OmpA-like peptidoglycan-associated protein|nr:OmpA family protein [Acidobacteriota bacterium]
MKRRASFIVTAALLFGATAATAAEITLNAVTYPERRTVKLDLVPSAEAPRAEVRAKVQAHEAQTQIEIDYRDMKPAILFGGDVTCYVAWAVTRDGNAENLGELQLDGDKGKVRFSTGQKTFALLVTAEPYSLVERPSEMIMFTGSPSKDKRAPSTAFAYSGLAPAPAHALSSIADIAWDSSKPLDLLQAEKAHELADRSGAGSYAPEIYRESTIALNQARALASASRRTKERVDFARRVVALASDSIQITTRRKEAERLAKEIAARKAEMKALEERAGAAESRAKSAQAALTEAQTSLQASQVALAEAARQKAAAEAAREQAVAEAASQKAAAEAAAADAVKQKAAAAAAVASAQSELTRMGTEKEQLEQSMTDLRSEKERLSSRLQGALSKVAETQKSARGLIVNLPDILFDVNQATLKPEAQLALAKLAGILLIMPELNLRVEGHTDATGSDAYNLSLSQQRAEAVRQLLQEQGVAGDRITTVGYGKSRPIADNATAEGRRKNRRVEIVIAEGVVAAEPAPAGN